MIDPRPFVGPPEVSVSGFAHGSGLGKPPEFRNVIGDLWPMALCGQSSLVSESSLHLFRCVGKRQEPVGVQTFIPEAPIEGFDERVVGGLSWL